MKRVFVIYTFISVCICMHAQINTKKLDSLSILLERSSDEFEETTPKQVADPDHRLKEAKILSGNDYCAIAEVPAHYEKGVFYNTLGYDIYYFFSNVYNGNRRTIKISAFEKKFNTSYKDFYGKWKDQYGTIFTFSSPNKVRIVNINKATKKFKCPNWGTGPDYQTGTINLKFDNTFYYATVNGLFYIYMDKVIHNQTFSPANLHGWCKRGLINYYKSNLALNYYFDQSHVVYLSKDEIHLKSFYDNTIFILKRISQ